MAVVRVEVTSAEIQNAIGILDDLIEAAEMKTTVHPYTAIGALSLVIMALGIVLDETGDAR